MFGVRKLIRLGEVGEVIARRRDDIRQHGCQNQQEQHDAGTNRKAIAPKTTQCVAPQRIGLRALWLGSPLQRNSGRAHRLGPYSRTRGSTTVYSTSLIKYVTLHSVAT